jgi:LmbE family N-acetylglucosaminyl deacetylase
VVSTLVCFHAHPDDEASSTGGLIAKAAAAGHRVLVVVATGGEVGEIQPGVLPDGEHLRVRRLDELAESARILGAEPPRLLGYRDSGMMGEPTNDDPRCFWRADVEDAARRLADLLEREGADVLTVYDDHGLYGHPDHIQVHRVGHRAAELAGVRHVYEATINRDLVAASMDELGEEPGEEGPGEDFGVIADDLSYVVDVSDHLVQKRAALAVHRSQIGADSFFLAMPEDRFAAFFGQEWFAVRGRTGTGGPSPVRLLPGLD